MSTTVVLHPGGLFEWELECKHVPAGAWKMSSAECAVISLGGDPNNGVFNFARCL